MEKHIRNYLVLSVIGLVLTGCTYMTKYDNSLTRAEITSDVAKLRVIGPNGFHGVNVQISDGDDPIGEFNKEGELSWAHQPGYAALIAATVFPKTFTQKHVLVFKVDAGKTYSFHVETSMGPSASVVPDDNQVIPILYEEFVGRSSAAITDEWKKILAKHSSE